MAKKKFSITIDPETVMYTTISKSKEYNSARMVVKIGDNEYMTVGYEWEGDHVPDFAMNLMDFMKANHVETSGVWPAFVDSDEERCEGIEAAVWREDAGAGSEQICKNCKKTKDKCDCGNWQPMPYKTKDQKENKTT